jgi:hypothetical protein
MTDRRNNYRIFVGNLKERGHLEYPGVDGRNNIKMNLQELGRGHGLD